MVFAEGEQPMASPSSRPPKPAYLQATTADLVERVRALIVPGERRILGLTGAPGAGKSTLAAALAQALGEAVAVVGMDGFHLANEELERLGRRGRKGAPDTFDAGGYVALLRRLRYAGETVYAPRFDRDLEQSIGSAVPVFAGMPLVITEGNYLLLEQGAWGEVRPLLDAVWFLAPPEHVRLSRLIGRHQAHGRSRADAEAWVSRVDQENAKAIEATRPRADLIVTLMD